MGWYIPVKDNCTLKGSNGAFRKYYKRADCVRKEIEECIRLTKAQELWYITEEQFWNLAWPDVNVLRANGKCVRSVNHENC